MLALKLISLLINLFCVVLLMVCGAAHAEPAALFHTSGFQAPVHAGPGDLLWLAGAGFHASDRVVYSDPQTRSAVAKILAVTPDQGIVVQLPESLQSGAPGTLVVVSASGERSVPVVVNDPRPQWLSPSIVYATATVPEIGRSIRIVGRNFEFAANTAAEVRLLGPATYTVATKPAGATQRSLGAYVIEVPLPEKLIPGFYRVSIRRGASSWIELPDQSLEVVKDPPETGQFRLDDPAFGACRAGSALNSNLCLLRALQAARRAGGGTIIIPPGIWRLSTSMSTPDATGNGFVVDSQINVRGSGTESDPSIVMRADPLDAGHLSALFTLNGQNSFDNLVFRDDAPFTSWANARPVLRLGRAGIAVPGSNHSSGAISDIAVSHNRFERTGVAIMDEGGWPLSRLTIVRNVFVTFSTAIELTGGVPRPGVPFRLDDSVIRWNRFAPGKYTDLVARQGPIASQIGAANRVDFSDNIADGASREGLDNAADPGGFRAGFFWNMSNNLERLLVSRNQVLCPGDRDGDGEAFAFDNDRGAENGLPGSPAIRAAGANWITVDAALPAQQGMDAPKGGYYIGHWVQIVSGRGLGQARRIVAYEEDPASHRLTVHVAPDWDVSPEAGVSRVSVTRLGWGILVVDNDIDSRAPPCHKSNLTGPNSGVISIWGPSADSVIDGNLQRESAGIQFQMGFKHITPGCKENCENSVASQTSLEIRNNEIDGEYDWDSACSLSGIVGLYGATPDPSTPPPILGSGISIAHNSIRRADGLGGGAIDFAPGWYAGPPPGTWTIALRPLVFGNALSDIDGPPPRATCRYPAAPRVGIRLGERSNINGAVLAGNHCARVATGVVDHGKQTVQVCPTQARSGLCECQRP